MAVGDLHGRRDLLDIILDGLRGEGIDLLFLGDLIDRAKNPEDDVYILDTIEQLRACPDAHGFSSVECLRGNHEDMFLGAVEYAREPGFRHLQKLDLWVRNGGAEGKLEEMAHHADWISELPLYKLVDKTLFVHAGVCPNVPLENQRKEDLVWIRDQFLNAQYINVPGVNRVVHGHTPNFWGNPVVTKDRICLDTGAFTTGVLMLYNHRSGELIRVEA